MAAARRYYRTIRARQRQPETASSDGFSLINILKDGLLFAFFTVMLYLVAGSYSFGYQDQFGFTYLSLGVEDLVISSRAVVVQFVLAVLSVTFAWAIFRISFSRLSPSLAETMFSSFPVALICVFLSTGVRIHDFDRVDPHSGWILGAYYGLELLCVAIRRRRPRLMHRLENHLGEVRVVQLGAGAFLVLLLAFDLGILSAVNQREFSFCPRKDNADWVEVQLTGDVVVCAEADIAKQLIYRRFHYVKLKDGPDSIIFETRSFVPRCIGVPKNPSEWSVGCRPPTPMQLTPKS